MNGTYNDIYINARHALKNAGIESYALEARLLVAGAAGKTSADLLRDIALFAAPELESVVAGYVARRIAGEPVAYITGRWEFCGVPLNITRDVLIPRDDTELIVRAAVELFRSRNGTPRILDLCTGSGCIGAALAVQLPGSRIVMVDNDPKALALCRSNVLLNKLGLRVMCIEADATKKPPVLLGNFDLLVCNAPYIPTAELETLDVSVRDYEPVQALDGGEDGLQIIRPVITLWKNVLKPGGTIMLEICEGQADAVSSILESAGFSHIGALKDTGGTDRVIIAQY